MSCAIPTGFPGSKYHECKRSDPEQRNCERHGGIERSYSHAAPQSVERGYHATTLHIANKTFAVPAINVPARYATLFPLVTSRPAGDVVHGNVASQQACQSGSMLESWRHQLCYSFTKRLPVGMSRFDIFSSGYPDVVMRTPSTMLVISPHAGARSPRPRPEKQSPPTPAGTTGAPASG